MISESYISFFILLTIIASFVGLALLPIDIVVEEEIGEEELVTE